MARPGITKQEVFEAADQLVGLGKEPTIEQVRHILKTGSNSTIGCHLRDWRESQSDTKLVSINDGLPQDMVTMMRNLWDRLAAQADQQVSEAEVTHQQLMSEVEQELQKYKTNNRRWQILFNQWQQEKSSLVNEKETLEQALDFAHKEIATLNAKQDGLFQQLQEKQARIDELHQLHQQAQQNLEHDRETVREERLLEQERHEQQTRELEQEVKIFKDQMTVVKDQLVSTQTQYSTLRQMCSQLEINYKQQAEQFLKMQAEKISYQQLSQQLEKQRDDAKHALNDVMKQMSELQADNKVLVKELHEFRSELNEQQDINKQLNQEKWLLGQEKAQLEGELRQIQKMKMAREKDVQ